MESSEPLSRTRACTRAVSLATSAADGEEALTGILEEAASALGGVAAAVLEGRDAVCRAVWGCEPAALLPLLQEAGAIRQVLEEPAGGGEEAVALSRADSGATWADGIQRLLLAPLRFRGVAQGALAVLFQQDRPAQEEELEAVTMFAGLASLVLEHERVQREAQEAQRARDHFLTAINHELRTPATAFILTADLLRYEAAGALPPRLDRALHEAEEQVHQLATVLQRVLELSRLGDGASAERPDIVHPRTLVADLMRRMEPTARRKGLSLALYIPRSLAPLQTNAGRLQRILLHLLSNAIKYTTQGTIEVRLERSTQRLRRERPEPVLVVRVRDTGPGIPPEELERVLEPFTQVEEGARSDSRSRGLGLGLPLARQLARTLGGEVRIESALGAGTVASLVLPYQQAGAGG